MANAPLWAGGRRLHDLIDMSACPQIKWQPVAHTPCITILSPTAKGVIARHTIRARPSKALLLEVV